MKKESPTPSESEQERPTFPQAVKRLVGLIPDSYRKQTLGVGALMLLNALLELTGVAGVLPVALTVAEPESLEQEGVLRSLFLLSGFEEVRHFALLMLVIFVLLIVAMNVCSAATLWATNWLSLRMQHELSCRLLKQYLTRPYAWYLDRNTSALSKDVLHEVDQVTGILFLGGLTVLTKSLAAGVILLGLVVLEPYVAIGTMILVGLIYQRIFKSCRTLLNQIGTKRVEAQALRFKGVSEALASVKEARAFRSRSQLHAQFREHSSTYSDVRVQYALVGEVPRYLTEMLAILGILAVLLYLTTSQAATAIPLMGVYIMAVWRVVPAVQSVYRNAVNFQFYLPALDALYEELVLESPSGWGLEVAPPVPFEREVKLEQVVFSYPRSEEPALQGIDLTLPKNTSVALVGRTGEGKTTLADVVAGFLEPDSGRIWVDDLELTDENRGSWRDYVGCVPQEIYIADDTVARNIALGVLPEEIDLEHVKRVACIANVDEFVEAELPQGYDSVLGERGVSLSGGQRQRLGIARALYHRPRFLILDEATNSLDSLTERAVLDAIQELSEGTTFLVIAHRLSTVRACDQVCFIKAGRIEARGSFEELEEKVPELWEWVQLDRSGVRGD